MAESAAAATPSSGPGGKANPSGTWWKSLTARKKPKEAPAATPGTPRPPPPDPSEQLFAPPSSSDSRENQQPNLGSGSRRNLKISRSGRFKEKRKVRATLLAESPQQLFEGAGGGGGGAAAAAPNEETPCP
ncbi:proline-rich protein 15 [Eublepharis macularius]|uniref:Proline-rich protein 15 n=1 Tax=Eublepharis macularius TaxID=481883 RepID=A0AA97JWH4_EUBMA|nr:proline-rich protein 15 [Eublepharis macularius]